jgi:hypothetical protein
MLASGSFITEAANAVGIHRTSIAEWIARGQKALNEFGDLESVPECERVYAEFAYKAARTRARARVQALSAIRVAGETDWHANAWFLERTAPTLFGKRSSQHAGDSEQSVTDADAAAIEKARDLAEQHRRSQPLWCFVLGPRAVAPAARARVSR